MPPAVAFIILGTNKEPEPFLKQVWQIIKEQKFAQVLWCKTIQCFLGH